MNIIFILSQQRSGSTSLIQSLSKELDDSFIVFEEVFLDEPTELNRKIYPKLNLLPSHRFHEQNRNVYDYIEHIRNNKKIVIKLMLDQITPEIEEYIKINNVEVVFFNRRNIDCAKSSAKIKLGINRAHQLDKNGIIVKNTNYSSEHKIKLGILTILYFVKNLFYRFKYRYLIISSHTYEYPDFQSVIDHIK